MEIDAQSRVLRSSMDHYPDLWDTEHRPFGGTVPEDAAFEWAGISLDEVLPDEEVEVDDMLGLKGALPGAAFFPAGGSPAPMASVVPASVPVPYPVQYPVSYPYPYPVNYGPQFEIDDGPDIDADAIADLVAEKIAQRQSMVGADDAIAARFSKAEATVDGSTGLVPSYLLDQYAGVQEAVATRNKLDVGYRLGLAQGNALLRESATTAMEHLAADLEGTSYPSLAALDTAYTANLQRSGLLDAILKVNKAIGAGVDAAGDAASWSIPWWIWAGGGVLVLGAGLYFLSPLILAVLAKK
jgi:hypothetical protein